MNPLRYLTSQSTRPGFRQSDLLLRHKLAMSKDLYSKDLVGHFGCVNALEFSHGLGNFLSSGGDDRRILLWNMEKALSDIGKPSVMKGEHNSNIFCLAFDISNNTLMSGGNDEQVIVHDIATGVTKDVFLHNDAVYGLSPDPVNPHVFASSCEDGRVLIYDTRDSSGDPFCLANYASSMHSVMYNPVEPRLLATANAKEGVGLWDVRKPESCVLRYGGSSVQQSCMSVRFNQHGDRLIALRRRLPPVLYKLHSNLPVCEFDHSGYYNSCTMKSVTFAGDLDQYVISGSDEFNLYMWAVPEDLSERLYINSAHMVLKGHRSIVNQVRFNISNHLIVSSGVEKIIKAWSPYKLSTKQPDGDGYKKVARHRPVYSHEEYINLVLENGHVMSHDYSHESTEEDPRMIAFFDSLVQRELEGISSDDSLSSNEEALYSRIVQLSQSDIDSDDSLNDALEQSADGEQNFSPFTIAFASVMASQAAEGNDRFPRLNNALSNEERRAQETSTATLSSATTGSPNTNRSKETCDISKLVQKKKLELRNSIQKKIKDSSDKLSSCSSVDLSDSELSDITDGVLTDPQHVVGVEAENSLSQASKQLLDKVNECKKQSQVKLKKLRNLRRNVMQSESDASEDETKDKKVQIECLTSTPACKSNDGTSEKVKFKKFKRRNSDSVTNEENDKLKARASPDLGPYLQKAGSTNANLEIRKNIDELKCGKGKKYLPSESVTGKGKVKGNSIFGCNEFSDKYDYGQPKSEHTSSKKRRKSDSDRYCKTDIKGKNHTCRPETDQNDGFHENSQVREQYGDRCRSDFDRFDDKKSTDNWLSLTATSDRNKTCSSRTDTLSRHRSLSPIVTHKKLNHTEQRCVKDWEEHRHRGKHRKQDHNHRHAEDRHSNNIRDNSPRHDDVKPSCSYSVDKNTERSKERSNSHHVENSDSEDEARYSQRGKKREDSSEEDQPTWSEFKRFKNRLERARHRYKEHKKHKKHRRHSDF